MRGLKSLLVLILVITNLSTEAKQKDRNTIELFSNKKVKKAEGKNTPVSAKGSFVYKGQE